MCGEHRHNTYISRLRIFWTGIVTNCQVKCAVYYTAVHVRRIIALKLLQKEHMTLRSFDLDTTSTSFTNSRPQLTQIYMHRFECSLLGGMHCWKDLQQIYICDLQQMPVGLNRHFMRKLKTFTLLRLSEAQCLRIWAWTRMALAWTDRNSHYLIFDSGR